MRISPALLLLALGACSQATTTAPPSTVPPTDTGRIVTVFADEFDGTAIDRAKWLVYTGPVYNDEQQEYVDDPATMRLVRGAEAAGAEGGGALLIHAVHRPGSRAATGRADFASGRLHGRSTFTYGTAAARMKLPAGAGLWPAFWLLGVGAWPAHGEIDIMENVGDASWWSVALHGPGYSGNTPIVKRDTFPTLDATAWHVYEAIWTPGAITFRVDGRAIYEVTRAQVAVHGPPAALDSAKYVILNLALGGTYPKGVNGVSAPYPGLPASTVEKIAAGEGRVLVDWVRVTRREQR